MMFMGSLFSFCWERVFALTRTFSWQNSVCFCPASFCAPRSNSPAIPGISWLPRFAFQSPWWKGYLLGGDILSRTKVLEGLVGLHRTIQLQLLWHYWLGHRLGLPWYWIVRLGNEQRSFCHFEDCILDCFVDYDDYSISSKEFLPKVIDIMIICIKFTHSSPF